jgi:hypothetical protein
MIKTVKQACEFNSIITDCRMAQGIENLADLIADEGDGRDFFKRNFVTQGMEQLFREGMFRLSGKSDQAVFELSQAMGGGKTHMMTALGLLARHEHLRGEVLPMLNLVNQDTVDEKVYERLSERMRDRYDLFGSLPDTIKDEWIENVETMGEKMDEYIRAQQEATGFDLRYNTTISPDDTDWRDTAAVLSRRDLTDLMGRGWQ